MDCSPPGSSVHVTYQARGLKWVPISFSRGSSWPKDRTRISSVSCTDRQILYQWVSMNCLVVFKYLKIGKYQLRISWRAPWEFRKLTGNSVCDLHIYASLYWPTQGPVRGRQDGLHVLSETMLSDHVSLSRPLVLGPGGIKCPKQPTR